MQPGNNQRKILYVSAPIQRTIMLRVVLYWLGYNFLIFHLLFITSAAFWNGFEASFAECYLTFLRGNLLLVLCSLATLPIILRDMLRLTNHVAGPFVQFERALKAMTAGEEVGPVNLRKGDLVGKFKEVFNDFVRHYNAELRRPKPAETPAPETPPVQESPQPKPEVLTPTPDAKLEAELLGSLAPIDYGGTDLGSSMGLGLNRIS